MIRWLETLTLTDVPTVGAKAARLGAMATAGLNVPPGFVLVAIASADPPGAEAAVRAAYAELAARLSSEAPAVAVRSSAIGEDGADASFAGQLVSCLNVVGADAVWAAVKRCWASGESARVAMYGAKQGTGAAGTAVVVQALVAAEVAGVGFTANPVTGDRAELLLDASWGLGEAVVSGLTTPDRVRLDRRDGTLLSYDIGAKHLLVVPAEQGTRAVAPPDPCEGRPALSAADAEALLTLASRVEALFEAPQDFEWAFASRTLYALQSRPITALPPAPPAGGWAPPVAGGTFERRGFAEHFPGPVSPLAESLVLGAVSDVLVELAAEIGYALSAPALVTIHGYVYARSDMRSTPGRPLRAAWAGLRLLLDDPARWERAPGHQARLAPLLAQRPGSDAERVAWCEAYMREFGRTWADVHRLSGGWRWSELALRKALGGGTLAAARLLSGLSAGAGGEAPASFDPAVPLARTAVPDAGRLEKLAVDRAEAEREALASARGLSRLAMPLLIRWAQRYAAAREPAIAALGHGWGALRETLLDWGDRWSAEGRLSRPEAIFELSWPELKAAVATGSLPATDVLDAREASRADQALLAPPLELGAPARAAASNAIVGIPASPGTARGRVRVVRGPADFEAFLPGEILVAPATTPAWTPLFERAAAIVTDVGGPLSHGSIVAREYGVPAVLGTESATRRLKTGMAVIVDGDTGCVWPR